MGVQSLSQGTISPSAFASTSPSRRTSTVVFTPAATSEKSPVAVNRPPSSTVVSIVLKNGADASADVTRTTSRVPASRSVAPSMVAAGPFSMVTRSPSYTSVVSSCAAAAPARDAVASRRAVAIAGISLRRMAAPASGTEKPPPIA
nr:hypothetical protein [Halomicrobium salinisoli]